MRHSAATSLFPEPMLEALSFAQALQQACVAATTTLLRPNVPLPVDAGFVLLREFSKVWTRRPIFWSGSCVCQI